MSPDGFAGLLTDLRTDFPGVEDGVIVRQLEDAASSVALFGVEHHEAPGLVERLVRSHLEALQALREA